MVTVKFLEDDPQQLILLELISQAVLAATVKILRVARHNFRAETVEGLHGNAATGAAQQPLQSRPHGLLAGLAVRQAQNIFRQAVSPLQNPRHTHTKQLRLPRPRSGNY